MLITEERDKTLKVVDQVLVVFERGVPRAQQQCRLNAEVVIQDAEGFQLRATFTKSAVVGSRSRGCVRDSLQAPAIADQVRAVGVPLMHNAAPPAVIVVRAENIDNATHGANRRDRVGGEAFRAHSRNPGAYTHFAVKLKLSLRVAERAAQAHMYSGELGDCEACGEQSFFEKCVLLAHQVPGEFVNLDVLVKTVDSVSDIRRHVHSLDQVQRVLDFGTQHGDFVESWIFNTTYCQLQGQLAFGSGQASLPQSHTLLHCDSGGGRHHSEIERVAP